MRSLSRAQLVLWLLCWGCRRDEGLLGCPEGCFLVAPGLGFPHCLCFCPSPLCCTPEGARRCFSSLKAASLPFASWFSCRDCAHLALLPPSSLPQESHAGSPVCCQRKISPYSFTKHWLLHRGLGAVSAHQGSGAARAVPHCAAEGRRPALGLVFSPVLV